MNKESMSGVMYKGLEWGNYYDNPDKWLKSIYEEESEK